MQSSKGVAGIILYLTEAPKQSSGELKIFQQMVMKQTAGHPDREKYTRTPT